MVDRNGDIEEQAIACLACGFAELIIQGSERLAEFGDKWPAWEPGPQEFPCPKCGVTGAVWATEPRLVLRTLGIETTGTNLNLMPPPPPDSDPK